MKRLTMKEIQKLDEAWDIFMDYIGFNDMSTPLSIDQFEEVFKKIYKDSSYSDMKDVIVHSFQYDCYNWPLIEKDSNY